MTAFLHVLVYFVWNISHSKKDWARYDQKTYIGLHVKYLLFRYQLNINFLDRF